MEKNTLLLTREETRELLEAEKNNNPYVLTKTIEVKLLIVKKGKKYTYKVNDPFDKVEITDISKDYKIKVSYCDKLFKQSREETTFFITQNENLDELQNSTDAINRYNKLVRVNEEFIKEKKPNTYDEIILYEYDRETKENNIIRRWNLKKLAEKKAREKKVAKLQRELKLDD